MRVVESIGTGVTRNVENGRVVFEVVVVGEEELSLDDLTRLDEPARQQIVSFGYPRDVLNCSHGKQGILNQIVPTGRGLTTSLGEELQSESPCLQSERLQDLQDLRCRISNRDRHLGGLSRDVRVTIELERDIELQRVCAQ